MLRPVLPLFEYVVNQDYIAEFLCVNKEKVELECNGKCYLMQRVKEQQDKKKQNLPRIAMEEYPIGFVTLIDINTPKSISKTFAPFLVYCNHYRFCFSNSQFRPPASLV
ncbi:MAG: hypothetical protein AAFX53_03960 [Bacteroidota bacterium]